MTLPEVIYCQDCHKEGIQTAATWALPDPRNPKKADFYCEACLSDEGVDIGECETIEAWRRMQNIGVTPQASSEAACFCGNTLGHRGRHRTVRRAAAVPNRHKPKAKNSGAPSGAKGASVDPSNSSRATRSTFSPTPQNASNRVPRVINAEEAVVGKFKVLIVSLDTYNNDMAPARMVTTQYDPIIEHVKAMKAKTVSIIQCPTDVTPKNFRNRLAHILQRTNKLNVQLEQRTKENAVAIIREARA